MSFFESIFYMAWRGLAIGLIISAPMGPVGMLCIQRTLDKGRRAGLYTGIGAAISDFFYCLLTGFGLSFIEEFLEKNSNVIQLAGSAVLIGFGIYLFKKNPSKTLKKPASEHVSVKKSILGGFLFTFSNPLILFLTIGLFARFNFLLPEFQVHQYLTGFVFIFLGAFIWWWFITFTVDKVRSHFNIRSMWLINKIIGVIILLFAVVGIITATTALAKGENVKCWNDKRGFEEFNPEWEQHRGASAGHLNNSSSEPLRLLTNAWQPDLLEFRFKSKNLKPSRKNPWGIVVMGTDRGGGPVRELRYEFHPAESGFDGLSSSAALKVVTLLDDQPLESELFSDNADILTKLKKGAQGPDPSGVTNFFNLKASGSSVALYGGIHSPLLLAHTDLPFEFKVDSIGFYLSPSSSLEISEIKLTTDHFTPAHLIWDDPVFLSDYLQNSRDYMEGYWAVLDRSLEESLLKPGGDYRLAAVRSGEGYELIYVSGASVNASAWSQGMTKGKLIPSGIKGVWNVEWMDATHRPLSRDLKAQRDSDGVLTIQFPYQNSQIRLVKIQQALLQ